MGVSSSSERALAGKGEREIDSGTSRDGKIKQCLGGIGWWRDPLPPQAVDRGTKGL